MSQHSTRQVFHPGRTLAETLDSLGMSQQELSARTNLTPKHINEIIKAKSPVTPATAVKFEFALGVSSAFWNNLQSIYDIGLARAAYMKKRRDELSIVREKYVFYSELASWGYVKKTRDAFTKLEELLSFFGVASLGDVRQFSGVQYRKTDKYSEEALSAWLRIGEIDSRKITHPREYNADLLEASLEKIRSMTGLRAEDYSERLVAILRECGVSLVFTPYLKRSAVSGATRWLGNNQPLIQVSIKFKRNDALWFTIFHEIAHILLHGKNSSFIEWNKPDAGAAKEEQEADDYAADTLIPPADYQTFVAGPTDSKSIKLFAEQIGISPDMVSGRLAKDNLISWSVHQQEFVRRIELQPVGC